MPSPYPLFSWIPISLLILLGACQAWHPFHLGKDSISPELVETRQFRLGKNENVIGQLARMTLKQGDTLADIARHFTIGQHAIQAANPTIDIWLPKENQDLLLPLAMILPEAPRRGIVLNVAAMRLYHFPEAEADHVYSYPIGIGREGWETPLGRTRITEKKKNPVWLVPKSIRLEHHRKGDPLPAVVPPGPDNPLGKFALRLQMPGYLIHGTNKPYGVGLRISHGCVRMYPEDMEQLFELVKPGTPVRIVDQPYLVGWRNGQVYVQIHRPEAGKRQREKLWRRLTKRLQKIEKSGVSIDWPRVKQAVLEARGIPVLISTANNKEETSFTALPYVERPRQWRGSNSLPPLAAGWYLGLQGNYPIKEAARLVAMLRHQGPPLPARRLSASRGYRIVIGPYRKRSLAETNRRRLLRELELRAHVIEWERTWASAAPTNTGP